MPSPPLPPRIALTDDLHTGSVAFYKRKTAPVPAVEKTAPASGSAFVKGLVLFCVLQMAGWLTGLWKWREAEDRATAAARQTAIASRFGDGVLNDLALAREQSAKLDRERANLVRMLGEAERLHANLRGELNAAQQKHKEVLGNSQQALAEWNQYSQTLEKNLGMTREQLNQAADTLQQERTASQQQITQAEGDREGAEREAGNIAQQKQVVENQNRMLDQKAQGLDAENARLDGDVTRMRGVVSTLETSNAFLDSRNAALSVEISQLRSKVHALESRIHTLEQGKDNDRDNIQKRGN